MPVVALFHGIRILLYWSEHEAERPVAEHRLHSSGDASRLAALLLAHIWRICSFVAPCQPGASPLSMRRRVPPRAAMVDIRRGIVIAGYLPRRQLRLVLAWAELHGDELMQNWELARAGQPLRSIQGLA